MTKAGQNVYLYHFTRVAPGGEKLGAWHAAEISYVFGMVPPWLPQDRTDAALGEELDRATVVPEERMPADIVRMHSRVAYVDETTGARREVELVFPEESDMARGKVSVLAPVGAALLGLRLNQSIEWSFPDGRPRRLRVDGILAPEG